MDGGGADLFLTWLRRCRSAMVSGCSSRIGHALGGGVRLRARMIGLPTGQVAGGGALPECRER